MNVKELIDSAEAEADDRADGKAAEKADKLRYLNEAVDEACIRKRLLYEAVNESMCIIPIDAGQQVYPLGDLGDKWVFITMVVMVRDADINNQPALRIRSLEDLTIECPDWRNNQRGRLPYAVVLTDNTIEVAGRIESSGILKLQGYRLPLKALKADGDKPEISTIHHRLLTKWVLHRMYEVPDSEIFNPDKSLKALAQFEAYFGPRPDADLRKGMVADTVHHNRAWWL